MTATSKSPVTPEHDGATNLEPLIELLIETRNDLRSARQFEMADRIRNPPGGAWHSPGGHAPRRRVAIHRLAAAPQGSLTRRFRARLELTTFVNTILTTCGADPAPQ